ncbi:mitochondrial import inner membrane translocase subunit Tim29-like [Girardinichthys multiradiatus]|uniref:mitochondrial import inner membrane translocase subunit Tim29-like n=1 Tax=Girardinichthys multiradiatus TaxID=208333 RepID=UPI001FAC5F33|nr:mitochondrial import inner membrane translocase subunit Tim29-like [Girardinichthys multiradiatus]
MSSVRTARRMFCAAAQTAAAAGSSSRWERLKSSKAGVWCRSLLSDYKEACREMVVSAWEQPVKSSIYVTLLGGAWACFHTKPDQSSFEAALLERSTQLGLLSPWIRNGFSDGHVQNLVKLRNDDRLRYASLGLLCVVYQASYDPDTMLYEARCSNLSMPWRELPQRVLDIGFIGCWWILDSKMKDYDVNKDEYKHLPGYMQATSPPGPQEVERNETLHRDSWLPLTMEDKEEETTVVDRMENCWIQLEHWISSLKKKLLF